MSEAELVAHLAVTMLAQQYSFLFGQYDLHLSTLIDLYLTGYDVRRVLYQHSCGVSAPLLPADPVEQQLAVDKFRALTSSAAKSVDEEIRLFRGDTLDLRDNLHALFAKAARDTKAAERKRSDDFQELCRLCRRDVSATVALIKAETIKTTMELTAIQTLQDTLAAATREAADLRRKLQEVQQLYATDTHHLSQQLEAALFDGQQRVQQERQGMIQKMRRMIDDVELERQQHVDSLSRQNQLGAVSLEKIQSQLFDSKIEVQHLWDRIDLLEKAASRELESHQDECTKLQRQLAASEATQQLLLKEMNPQQHKDIPNFTFKAAAARQLRSSSNINNNDNGIDGIHHQLLLPSADIMSRSTSHAVVVPRLDALLSLPPPYREPSVSPHHKSPSSVRSPSEVYRRLSNYY